MGSSVITHIALFVGAISFLAIAKKLWPYSRVGASIVLAFPVIFLLVESFEVLGKAYHLLIEYPWVAIPIVIIVIVFAGHYLSAHIKSPSDPAAGDELPRREQAFPRETVLLELFGHTWTFFGSRMRLYRRFIRGAVYAAIPAFLVISGFTAWNIWDSRNTAEKEKGAAVQRELGRIRDVFEAELNRVVALNAGQLTEQFIEARVESVKGELLTAFRERIEAESKSNDREAERFIANLTSSVDEPSRSSLLADIKRGLEAAKLAALIGIDSSLQGLADQISTQLIKEFEPPIRARAIDGVHSKISETMEAQLASARIVLSEITAGQVSQSSIELSKSIVDKLSSATTTLALSTIANILGDEEQRINTRIRELMETRKTTILTDAEQAINKAYRVAAQSANEEIARRAEAARQEQDALTRQKQKEAEFRLAREAEARQSLAENERKLAEESREVAAESARVRTEDELRRSIATRGFVLHIDTDVTGAYPHSVNSGTVPSIVACADMCRRTSECDGFRTSPSGSSFYCMLFKNARISGSHPGVMSGLRSQR